MARFEDFKTVLRRFTVKDVMRHYGHAPEHEHKWKAFPHCPFCRSKNCAGVYTDKTTGIEKFKCHHSDCGEPPLDPVGYVAKAEGLSLKPEPGQKLSPAAVRYLKLAGAWREAEERSEAAPAGRPAAAEAPVEAGEIGVETGEIPEETGQELAESGGNPVENEPEVQGIWAEDEQGTGKGSEAEELGAEELREGPAAAEAGAAGEAEPVAAEASEAAESAESAEAAEPTRSALVLAALAEFHAAMPFTPEHLAECKAKRDLNEDTCRWAGLRSSVPANRAALEALRERYPMPVLVEAGLFVRDPRDAERWIPNKKFCGWGVVGEKPKAERRHRDDKLTYGLCCPIVIPFYDAQGRIVALKPRKDYVEGDIVRIYEPANCLKGVAGKGMGAKESGKESLARESGAKESGAKESELPQLGMVTEGELKALRWWQDLPKHPVIGLPGIQAAKTLWAEVEEWLETRLAPRAMVAVVFDNEKQDDPKLPYFKEEELDRNHAVVWARLLARMISRAGYDGRVGRLPDQWRDAKGKADWDGAAALLRERPELCRVVGAKTIADAFLAVAKRALREKDFAQAGLFDSVADRHIYNYLERLDYEPRLKSGHGGEKSVVKRVGRFVARVRDDTERVPALWRGLLALLAAKYAEVGGRYYILTTAALGPKKLDLLQAEIERARVRDDVEYGRMLALLKEGLPKVVSDFTIKWHYAVRRVSGETERMVTIRSVWGGESPMVTLTPMEGSRPAEWRKWLLRNGNFAWLTGEREFQDLTADGNRLLHGKMVQEVPGYGYHEDSRIWFFEDCAIGPKGEVYRPKEGIFWIRLEGARAAQGYTFRRDRIGRPLCSEGQRFTQNEPELHPEVADLPDLSERWQEIQGKLFEAVGGLDAFGALGMVCAYAAMPELFAAWGSTPGLWLHGEPGQGKSSVARWLLRLMGFNVTSGKPIASSTLAKMRVALQQYSNLPFWLEEFQVGCEQNKVEMLKNIYDRSGGMKMDGDVMPREIRTSAIVSGVATSPEPQLKSRYFHVQVSTSRRKGDHYHWFQAESEKWFYQIGRALFRRREEYVRQFMALLKEWCEDPDMERVEARARMVHGVAYAGFVAATRLFGSLGEDGVRSYRTYLESYCRSAMTETRESVNVNQFWLDVVAGVQAGAFGDTPLEIGRFFAWRQKLVAHPPEDRMLEVAGASVAEQSRPGSWASAQLYFVPQMVIDALRAHKRKQGRDLPLDRHDLLAQMKVKSYWRWARRSDGTVETSGHRQRFGGMKQPQACWCVDVDYHELGLQPVSDQQLREALWHGGDPMQGYKTDVDDPRLGPLFVIRELLTVKGEPGE